MIKVGQELVLGEAEGYLQVFDIRKFEITQTQKFEADICDIIVIEESQQLLLAGYIGLVKATKDQSMKHYNQPKEARSICHIAESFYLVGF